MAADSEFLKVSSLLLVVVPLWGNNDAVDTSDVISSSNSASTLTILSLNRQKC